MTITKTLFTAATASAALAVAACAPTSGNTNVAAAPPAAANEMSLALSGVMPLQNGYHYEGWAIIDGQPVSTGRFNVNSSGAFVDLDGRAIANNAFTGNADLSSAAAVVISIEPPRDSDPRPSDAKFLGGPVQNGVASLSPMFPKAIGDFSDLGGKYILATPTDGMNTNETSGVWFLLAPNGPTGAKVPSLQLAELPAAWVYEGWVIVDGKPISTGKFRTAAGADNSAIYSGTGSAPPFPGEDFIRNAPTGVSFPQSLAGDKVVISIEPAMDDSPAPFSLKPLSGAIPADAKPMTPYTLSFAGNQVGGQARIN